MPDQPIGSDPLTQLGGNLIQGTMNAWMEGRRNKMQQQWTLDMYNRQRADSLADWNMMNQYNSPAAQMARAKEAGINPYGLFSNGGSVMQAATVRSSDMQNYNPMPMEGTQLGSIMAQSASIKLQNAQQANTEQQTELLRQQKAGVIIDNINKATAGEHSKFDLDRKQELKQVIFEQGVADLGLTKAKIDESVHGNFRANEMQVKALKGADLDNAAKKIENLTSNEQLEQYRQMRPLELARIKKELELLQEQIIKTRQEAKNEHEITRLNKMEADLGKGIRMVRDILGVVPTPGKRH